mmetsp:Transcript_72234/g.192051  ORF Transcript_72234/g.192051 Transcript_72234/m.192051 type:complete len:1322 (+) Transcript_72234:80-4045(+)
MEDLAKLDSIDDAAVMQTLQQRHEKDEIYTKNGAVLIAINPYKAITCYEQANLAQYKGAIALEREPPHIFAVSAAAHRTMISTGNNQAVVISGESGAGKTETARFVLLYLRYVSNTGDELERRIADSQPLTEAFGCAKTLRNDNSSRFGKFLKLHFDVSAKIKGASLSTYLLEKSRVCFVGDGERSYHIFYALVKGMPDAQRKELFLPSADASKYKYLSNGWNGEAGGGLKDDKNYLVIRDGLLSQGMAEAEILELWQLIAGILLLGSVVFDPSKVDAAAVMPASTSALRDAEAVLGLQSEMLAKALTKRKIKAGNEWVEQDLSLAAANDGRDALSKAIYSRLFDRLIAKINAALAQGGSVDKDDRIIGIVDIFGFEVFEQNSLEQLCINFANEKLQALFTKTVFIETIEAYKQDGIDAAEIVYVDNAPLIQLFDAPKVGMWALLTEECMIPKGSDSGFTEKVFAAHPKSATLHTLKGVSRQDGFMVEHFAGSVGYSTKAWLEKNKDPLNGDLVVLMQFSDNTTLRALFGESDTAPAAPGAKFKSNKFQGIINTFRTQLGELNAILDQSDRHFVRCFKPNDAKKADTWDANTVKRQLHTSGVLDALRVARTGFPDRMVFAEFVNTFSIITGKRVMDGSTPKEQCSKLLPELSIPAAACKMGNERVFLSAGTLEKLKTRRIESMAGVCVRMQAVARAMTARKFARKIREQRLERLQKMQGLTSGDDIETLRESIDLAMAVGVQYMPSGKAAVDQAKARLTQLEKEQAERIAAAKALEKAMGGHEAEPLRQALAAARRWAVDGEIISKAQSRLQKLEEEEQTRRDEEKRLAAASAAERDQEAKKLEETRKKRMMDEDTRRRKEETEEVAAKAAAAEAAEATAAAQKAKEEAEQQAKALEEEEAMRERVLARLEDEKIRFRSGPADVLEYAVYLGMQLEEDIHLLWIADEALQAEDPEGWDQCESPNGDTYYMNAVTKQVLWQHPLDYTYQQKYLAAKAGNLQPPSDGPGSSAAPSTPSDQPGRDSFGAATGLAKTGGQEAANFTLPKDVSAVSEEDLVAVVQKLLGTKHPDLRNLLIEPSNSMAPMRCYVNRHKSRMGGTKFDFFMSISANKDMYCFTGKRQPVAKGCYYSIALDQDESKRSKTSGESFIGKVRSDRKSMEYTLYDDGKNPDSKEAGPLRRELLHVNFINSLRNRNPGAMEVIVPNVDNNGNCVAVQPDEANPEGLKDKLAAGKLANTMVFKNREPKWNKESNMYQLDFQGRATLASCKNIQLSPKTGAENDVRFLMGKVHDNTFNVDFAKPFSALQAFAFALIVFDNSSGSF